MKKLLLYAIIACITSVIPMNIKAAEAYAALSNDNTTLTFYCDNEKSNRDGMGIGPFENMSQRGWHNNREEIIMVVFDNSFSSIRDLTSTAYWFEELRNLKKIIGIENLETGNVIDMSEMFYSCKSLPNLDVSHFDTKNVTSMAGLFADCESLTSLDVSSFNTEKVTNMAVMFGGCESLSSLNVDNFDTSNVTNMAVMFCQCPFSSIDLHNFDTSNVIDMGNMFEECSSLKTLDLSNFDTSNVTNMRRMFSDCNALITIFVSELWSIDNLSEVGPMFRRCWSLVGGNGTVWDETHIDNTYAHIDGGASNPGYLTYKAAGGQSVKKCATPTITFVDGKLKFSCETEGVEFTYDVTNADVKKGNGNEVTIGGTYKVSVYATKAGYDDSDVTTLEFALGAGGEVCDVNKDGAVDVADIATIIDKMASGARVQEKTEE